MFMGYELTYIYPVGFPFLPSVAYHAGRSTSMSHLTSPECQLSLIQMERARQAVLDNPTPQIRL